MPRTKTGVVRSRRHKKILKLAKGYRGTNSRLYKRAHEAVLHAGQYAFVGRKLRKRDMRKLWITRLSAAVKMASEKLNYSQFIRLLKKTDIQLDRKTLSNIAVRDFDTFKSIVEKVQG